MKVGETTAMTMKTNASTNMKTTEREPKAQARSSSPSPVRAYLVAWLATSYVAAWWWFGAPASSTGKKPGPAPSMDHVSAAERLPELGRRAVWLSDLPSSARPLVVAPRGWHLADRNPPSTSSVPIRPARVRRGRVRTRSS